MHDIIETISFPVGSIVMSEYWHEDVFRMVFLWYYSCEVSCKLSNVHWSYKHFVVKKGCVRKAQNSHSVTATLVTKNTCQILVISCCHSVALWLWLNITTWIDSGWDSYDTYTVWCILDNIHWSHKHFIFNGKMDKMVDLPCPRSDSKRDDFNNF